MATVNKNMETLEQLEKELEIAKEKHNTVLNNLPSGIDNFEKFERTLEPTATKIAKLSRKIRMIKQKNTND